MRGYLPDLSPAQKSWMERNPFTSVGYYWKRGEVWCQECGHIEKVSVPQLAVDLECDDYICPHCNRRLTLKHYSQCRGRGYERQGAYCTVVTTMRGWTVFRTFMSIRENVKGEPTVYEQKEVYQNWVSPEGREVIISRHYTRSPWHMTWDYDSPWRANRHNGGCSGYFVSSDVFDVSRNYLYPLIRVSALARRNGFDCRMMSDDPCEAVKALLSDPRMEMLAKCGQPKLFAHFVRYGRDEMERYFHAIRICIRNGYEVSSVVEWKDYIRLLEHFGRDTHNAHYVCPDDLKAEHDRLVAKKNAEDERRRRQEQKEEAIRHEKDYKKMHGRYFGIVFGGNGIEVHVISSVEEMAEEGEVMHHCVFANEYYKKEHSLILSARDSEGRRMETIEIDTRSWRVVQSRGLLNHPTERHDDIVALVEKNMNKFKRAV